MIENDPRDRAYAALYLAIIWFRQIQPEQALRLIQGRSSMKPGVKLTPEMMEQIEHKLRNPQFRSLNDLEKKFKVSRYDVFAAIKEKRKGEENQ